MKNMRETLPTILSEILTEISNIEFAQIYEVEKEASGEEVVLKEEDLREALEKPGAINVVLKNSGGRIVGFINGMPNDQIYHELIEDDPEFLNDPARMYVYDFAIKKESRSLANFLSLIKKLVEEMQRRNLAMLTMHTRKSEGLSNVLQKRYHAKRLRTLINWQGWGEDFDYLELGLK
ncbi:MAG: hypothetical protein A2593_04900 [Candidatus Moranbacteria bacterium RIFOXYD1_FULL_44_9]|nr:MAG: hypothetical protein A2593_04900 [Candidatus Moranbacteria bacterium RIFOXYD1_FULL_44_9]